MSLIADFQSRYSTKVFDPLKNVSVEDIHTLIEAARLAPTALGISVVRLIHVQDRGVRSELKKYSLHQSQITDASDMLVFAVKTRFDQQDIVDHIAMIAHTRDIAPSALSDHQKLIENVLASFSEKELVDWFQKQAFISLGFVLSQCAEMHIDSCPIGLFDAAKYDEILGLTEQGLHATVLLMVGCRSERDVCQSFPKVRIGTDEFLASTLV